MASSVLSGQSATGKVVSLLNDHHVSPVIRTNGRNSNQHPLYVTQEPSMNAPRNQLHGIQEIPDAKPADTTKLKKKHVCPTCDRPFTTSGHLARHQRVHTGERNHKCPFPGCETRCSRQDNLQQHYRIHLSPRSRRNSSSATRAAIARAIENNATPNTSSTSTPNRSPPNGAAPLPVLNALGLQPTNGAPEYPAGVPAYPTSAYPQPGPATQYIPSSAQFHTPYPPYPAPYQSAYPPEGGPNHQPQSYARSAYPAPPPGSTSRASNSPSSHASTISSGPATPMWAGSPPVHPGTVVLEPALDPAVSGFGGTGAYAPRSPPPILPPITGHRYPTQGQFAAAPVGWSKSGPPSPEDMKRKSYE